MTQPIIFAGMIARNESRDIGKAIASILPAVDGIVLVDTGSTDDTIAVAMRAAGSRPFLYETFTDASERDAEGNWRIVDFSRARNRYVAVIDATPATHLLWLDADEVLRHPQAIRRAAYYAAKDCFAVWMQDGGTRWQRQCMWRTRIGIRFEGACHEYPVLGNARGFTLDDCTIVHDGAPAPNQEDSNARNLRILLAEYERRPTERNAFYLANTYKDAGKHEEAIRWYKVRIAMGGAHPDEWLFSMLYCARCERTIKRYDDAEATLQAAIAAAPGWAEFHMDRAFMAYDCGDYKRAIELAGQSPREPIPVTHLFREVTMYRDQPARLTSWSYEHMGDTASALQWAEHAAQLIGGPDNDWTARIAKLRKIVGPAHVVASPKIEGIALCRPGAIGDILMTLNVLPALREANPDKPIYYFCDARLGGMDALGPTLRAAGVDVIMDSAQWSSWTPRFERAIPLVGYPLAAGYPDKRMKWHLIQYFAAEMGVVVPGITSLTLRRPARPVTYGGVPLPPRYATLQTRAGWSKYKEWHRWDDVVAALGSDIPIVRIGEESGATLAESIAVCANATMHLGIDSFANHLTNYFWTDDAGNGRKVPGVITWGSTQKSASGYRTNENISLGLQCQPCFRENPTISRMDRGPCINPPRVSYDDDTLTACAVGISFDAVVMIASLLWDRETRARDGGRGDE